MSAKKKKFPSSSQKPLVGSDMDKVYLENVRENVGVRNSKVNPSIKATKILEKTIKFNILRNLEANQ